MYSISSAVQLLTCCDVRRSSVLQLGLIRRCAQCCSHLFLPSVIYFFCFFSLFHLFLPSTFLSSYFCISSFVWCSFLHYFFSLSLPFFTYIIPYIRLLSIWFSISFCHFITFFLSFYFILFLCCLVVSLCTTFNRLFSSTCFLLAMKFPIPY
jgi:hypothetical protein